MAAEIHSNAAVATTSATMGPTAGTSSSSPDSTPTSLPPNHQGRCETGAKPQLVNKLEGGADDVHAVKIIPNENGIISISSDRSVRIWLLRDSGQYWPSICHYMGAAATAMCYHHGQRKLFIGLENGMISEFHVSNDYNTMDHIRDYHAHQSRVTAIKYSPSNKFLLSAARDKYFQYHDAESGRRLGGYLCGAWCTSLEYDEQDHYVFIGDYSGIITVCKVASNGVGGVQFVNNLKGHSGSIQSICWNGDKGWLYSGSYDASVFVWDIGGRKGTVYELHGHRNKVTTVIYSKTTDVLFSSGEDMHLVVWDMSAQRVETADWSESDNCQLCNRPFFWNFRSMYDQKQIGLRQHHCRKCGKAICDSCSTRRSQLPRRGHEFMVRMCEECYIGITEEEKKALANFYDLKQNVVTMDFDEDRRILASVGKDRIIKVWNLKEIL